MIPDHEEPQSVDLSVVIVSYNVRYHLEQCLRSVMAASEGLTVEIWVVDNASTDGSYTYLHERFPHVHFIANEENVGFSRANNQAIEKSGGRYVLLLNPDTLVGNETLRACIQFLDHHPKAGACGVRMLNPDGSFAPESRRGLPTPFTSFCKMSGLGTLFPQSRTFGRYYMRYLDVEEPNPIEVISGAFCMLRREALQEVGTLDEDYFMYGEDIDLSYRLLKGGWQNWYLPQPILHYKGESTVKSSFRYVHVFYNAMLIFFNKHFRSRYRLLGLLIRAAVCLRALVDMYLRAWYRLRIWLHCPPRERPVEYMTFNIDQTPVSHILAALQDQPHGRRRVLEIYSTSAHVRIRPGEPVIAEPSL